MRIHLLHTTNDYSRHRSTLFYCKHYNNIIYKPILQLFINIIIHMIHNVMMDEDNNINNVYILIGTQ